MPSDRFWELIGRTTEYQADPEQQLEALRHVLRQLTVAEIEAFERAFHQQQRRAYSWDLWGAGYVMNGGLSDDGFEYFQRWLVSKGRTVFEAALADPDRSPKRPLPIRKATMSSSHLPMSLPIYGRKRPASIP